MNIPVTNIGNNLEVLSSNLDGFYLSDTERWEKIFISLSDVAELRDFFIELSKNIEAEK